MTRVVILGGGFAGIAAAKALLKNTKRSEVQVILIDKNSYHLFTPSLYELATAEEITKNVCIPLKEILPGISMIKDEVLRINENNVQLKGQTIEFDYLIIALGSESAYYDIPGLKEFSLPFKTLEDSVRIKEALRKGSKIVIGGGGFSGTELASEIVKHIKGVELTIISGSACLLKDLDQRISDKAASRLGSSVNVVCQEHIKKVDKNFVFADSKKYSYDVLVWTGGVKANSIPSDFEKDERGDILVDENLRVKNEENIFAAGDIAVGYPYVAQVAEDEGKIAGENVANLIKNKPLKPYRYVHFGYVVPLGGHYAAAQLGSVVFMGFFGWIFEQIVLLRYLLSILPLTKAFKRWNKFEEYLMKS